MTTKNKSIRKPRGYKIKPRSKKVKKAPESLREPTLVGYMRVSTEKQDHALQYDALIKFGVLHDNIFQDTISGSKISREGLDGCIKFLIAGDILIVWKIDRFGRSLRDFLNKLNDLEEMGVSFQSATENIDTTTPAGRMMMQIIATFAEFESAMIRQRVKAGIKAKMDAGRPRWGKEPGSDYDPKEIIRLKKEENLTGTAIADKLEISTATVSRVLNKK